LVVGVLSYLVLDGGRLLTVASCFCCLVNWVLYIMLFFSPETEVMRRFSPILIRAQAVSTILLHNCEVLTVAKWLLQNVTFTVMMDPNKHALESADNWWLCCSFQQVLSVGSIEICIILIVS
jgi:hypothetical protein